MINRLEKLAERLPKENKELVMLSQHLLDAIEKMTDEHRRLVSIEALAGIKPNGEREKEFYENINCIRTIIFNELEKTVEDIEHKGDKNWEKHYKDGV